MRQDSKRCKEGKRDHKGDLIPLIKYQRLNGLCFYVKTMQKLTKKQTDILSFISQMIIAKGQSPTLMEIGEHFSFSAEGAYYAVKALEKKGYIKRDEKKKRSITLSLPEKEKRENIQFPYFAKEPTKEEIEKDSDTYIFLPYSMKKDDVFAYSVTSCSMINAGILEGDTAIIKRSITAEEGDIVLVEKEEGTQLELRRLHKGQGIIELWAENDTMGIIRRKEFSIFGILLEIRRHY